MAWSDACLDLATRLAASRAIMFIEKHKTDSTVKATPNSDTWRDSQEPGTTSRRGWRKTSGIMPLTRMTLQGGCIVQSI